MRGYERHIDNGRCGGLATIGGALLLLQVLGGGELAAQRREVRERAVCRALIDRLGTAQDSLPTVDRIVERYVEAVGGRDAIAALTTRVMRGRLVTDLPTWSPPVYEDVAIEIRAATSRGYLVSMRTAEGMHWDGYDGVIEWSMDGERVSLHDGVDLRFAWLVDPQHALRMREYFPRMTHGGSARLGDRLTYVVAIDDDESHDLHFDAESGLLVRLGYNRELSEYREVDGVLVPFRMAISRKGGSTTYGFERIEHNVTVDVTAFAVPDTTGGA